MHRSVPDPRGDGPVLTTAGRAHSTHPGTIAPATRFAEPTCARRRGVVSRCADTAKVGWEIDLETSTVTGVRVEVPGCDDGEFVGIELITDAGDVPSEEPLAGEVAAEVATFDVTSFGLHVEPVTGIRVYLEVDAIPVPVVAITVEQRFFNPAGNEQFGLRVTTPLTIPFEQSYTVPSAGPGYQDADCDETNLVLDDGEAPVVGWGTGDFVATASGRHIACYQQVPGSPGGPSTAPPEVQEPEVLGVVLERGAADTGDHGDDASALGQVLARTGLDAIHLIVSAAIALVGGTALLVGRPSRVAGKSGPSRR
jgi:hypothetical protein